MRFLTILVLLCSLAGAQTAYRNEVYDAYYLPPLGWTMTQPVGGNGRLTFESTRPGFATMHLEFQKSGTAIEMLFFRTAYIFNKMDIFYDLNPLAEAPRLTAINDTLGSPAFSFAVLKQPDKNMVLAMHTASYGNSFQAFWYLTTISDHELNGTEYFKHWLSTDFLSRMPTPIATFPKEGLERKMKAFDLLGRMRSDGAGATRIKAFPLPSR